MHVLLSLLATLLLLAQCFGKTTTSFVSAVSTTSTLSDTTSTFVTPSTQTSIQYITFTLPTSVQFVTHTATPATSTFVTVTVANIHVGRGPLSLNFIKLASSTSTA